MLFSMWNPYLKRDIELIGKVLCGATKSICSLNNKSHQDCSSLLGADTVQQRRSIFCLIEVFKIVHNLCCYNFQFSFLFDIY